jgi:hypothetical protein
VWDQFPRESPPRCAPLTPAKASTPDTIVQVYNGAQNHLPASLALLQQLLGVKPVFVRNHAVQVDIIITTTSRTPTLSPPPAP